MSMESLKKTAAGNLALAIYAKTNSTGEKISMNNFNKFLNSIHVPEEEQVTGDVSLQQAKEIIMKYSIANRSSGAGATDVCREWKSNLGLTFSNDAPPAPAAEPPAPAAEPPAAAPEPVAQEKELTPLQQERRNIRKHYRDEIAANKAEYQSQVNGKISDRKEKFKKQVHAKVNNEKAKGKKIAKKVNEKFQNAKPGGEKQGKDMTLGQLVGTAFVEANRRGARGVYEHGKMLANQAADAVESVTGATADAVAYVNKEVVQPLKKHGKNILTILKDGNKLLYNGAKSLIKGTMDNARKA